MVDVSIILPVYNGERYLGDAIESLLRQTYKSFELLIINDGSSDNSISIAEEYKKIDNRIIIINRENKGLIYSLNEGISLARGEFIARMDSDDVCCVDRLEKQLAYMKSKELDICGSHYMEIDEDSSIIRLRKVPVEEGLIAMALVSRVPFAHPSVMIRKSFITDNNIKYGQSNFKFAEDLDLWTRLSFKGALFGNVNDVLFKYRVLNYSLSRRNRSNLIKDTRNINYNYFNKRKYDLEKIASAIDVKKINNIEDAQILSSYIFRSIYSGFQLANISKLPIGFKKAILLSFLKEMKYFLGL